MNKIQTAKKFKSLLPYFTLALAVIVANRAINEIDFFLDFARQVWGIMLPFLYGFVLAYIINLPCGSIQRLLAKTGNKFILRKQRVFSILIVFLALVAIVAIALNFVIPILAGNIMFFIENAPVYWENIMRFTEQFNELDLFGIYISAENVLGWLGDWFADFDIGNLLAPINVLIGAGGAVFTGFIALISSIYILIEKDRFKAFIGRMLKIFVSDKARIATTEIFVNLNKNFRQYIRTQTIDGLILGTMATILLYILGSPFALVLGIMLGIVNYVPYFGSIFGTLIAVIVVAFTQGITMGAIAAVSLFVVQQIDANVVQPKLMSGSFSMSPLLIIISITIGGAIAGIFGMIVAIPIVAVLNDIFFNIVDYYENRGQKEK